MLTYAKKLLIVSGCALLVQSCSLLTSDPNQDLLKIMENLQDPVVNNRTVWLTRKQYKVLRDKALRTDGIKLPDHITGKQKNKALQRPNDFLPNIESRQLDPLPLNKQASDTSSQ